jgi:hypothetical protein
MSQGTALLMLAELEYGSDLWTLGEEVEVTGKSMLSLRGCKFMVEPRRLQAQQ